MHSSVTESSNVIILSPVETQTSPFSITTRIRVAFAKQMWNPTSHRHTHTHTHTRSKTSSARLYRIMRSQTEGFHLTIHSFEYRFDRTRGGIIATEKPSSSRSHYPEGGEASSLFAFFLPSSSFPPYSLTCLSSRLRGSSPRNTFLVSLNFTRPARYRETTRRTSRDETHPRQESVNDTTVTRDE